MAETLSATCAASRERAFRATRAMLLALSLALFAAVLPARAVPPKYFIIDNPRMEVESGVIMAKLGISVDNVTGLFEMLKDGASVELVIGAKLERVRTLWANVTITEAELVSTLQHNPLTREFALCMPGETKPLLDKNLDRLLAATWYKLGVAFGPLSLLDGQDSDENYRIVLSLSLQHAKAPPWLVKNFMFWSKNIVEPETVTLPFRY